MASDLVFLDGPLGTELDARGVATPLPGWSCHALEDAPDTVAAIHRDYAAAGASVHTTNTFRARASVFPERWEALARKAVRLAREAVGPRLRVAGSIAPLADCYRPDLSPALADPDGTRAQHAALARVLAEEGCDLLLCETFPRADEAWLALEGARATGLETWVSFTPGPDADLLTPQEIAVGARRAIERGAGAVLVNCAPAARTLPFVRALVEAARGDVPVGVYANAGRSDDVKGWASRPGAPDAYAELAAEWNAAGATILGSCCGTGPAHVAALVRRLGNERTPR